MGMSSFQVARILRMSLLLGCCGALFLGTGASAGTLDQVRDTGVFKIGYRTDAAPYSYKSDSGEPSGYVVDLCREVAAAVKKAAGREVKVEYVVVTAEDRFDAVQSGKIDILCEATTATLARRKLVDFSIMTFIDGAGVMVREDGPQSFAAMAGQKIGVHAGTTTLAALKKSLSDNKIEAEVIPVADHEDGVKKLESGELAAYFADRAILSFLLIGTGFAEEPDDRQGLSDARTLCPGYGPRRRGFPAAGRQYPGAALSEQNHRQDLRAQFRQCQTERRLKGALYHQRATGIDSSRQLSHRLTLGYPVAPHCKPIMRSRQNAQRQTHRICGRLAGGARRL